MLSGEDLADAIQQLWLLLNTCRQEAYGRSILEALCVGTRVLSVPSPGSRALTKTFLLEAEELIVADPTTLDASEVLRLCPCLTTNELRNFVARGQNTGCKSLAAAWTVLCRVE
jgi:glycosyltransferase involved in cell wall biosynthesis